MVYRALTEYLVAQPGPKIFRPWVILVPTLLTFVVMTLSPHPAVVVFLALLSLTASIWIELWLRDRRRRTLEAQGNLEYSQWLATLSGWARAGQLEERSHPDAMEDLEACARCRKEILAALGSDDWDRLGQKPGWEEVRSQCRTSAERLFEDALWAAKGAFRPMRARKNTFKKRCQRPGFAAESLGKLELIRAQMEKLLEEVHEDPFAAQDVRDALARAQTELKAIRDAEAEVRGL